MKAVLDPNVIISAALSPGGSPGRVFRYWLEGAFDLIVSPLLLEELGRALGYSKLRDRIPEHEAEQLIELLSRGGVVVEDPSSPSAISSSDPDDDYLIALADKSRAAIVSGDSDLLDLANEIPVYSPGQFETLIEESN